MNEWQQYMTGEKSERVKKEHIWYINLIPYIKCDTGLSHIFNADIENVIGEIRCHTYEADR